MTGKSVMLAPVFDYTVLTADEAAFLEEARDFIRARYALTYQLVVEIGARLIAVRNRIQDGTWLAWVRAELPFSEDTAENYINVARYLPQVPEQAVSQFQIAALYRLASPNVPEEARQAAVNRASQGFRVDKDEAYILSHADPDTRRRYFNGELPKQQAKALVEALNHKGLPPVVRRFCLQQRVSDAAVVRYLAQAWFDRERTRHHKQPRTTWDDLVEDGALNGDGWAVPLSMANERDLQVFVKERQRHHIIEAMEEKWEQRMGRGRLTRVHGQLVVADLSPVLLEVFGRYEGEEVEIQIRVRKKAGG